MPTCPACERELAPWRRVREVALLRCAACGFARLDPLPAPDALLRHYEGAHRDYFDKAASKLRRARRRMRRLARAIGAGRSLRFLDVGAHGGFSALAASEQGWQVTALDPDAQALRRAGALLPTANYLCARLEEAPLPAAAFDLIHCSEVIEHAPDPDAFAAALARAARPGGHLFLTTPDLGHWARPSDLSRWDGFDPPWHCSYFTATALCLLLARHGFRVRHRWPAFKPGIKLLAERAGGDPANRATAIPARPPAR